MGRKSRRNGDVIRNKNKRKFMEKLNKLKEKIESIPEEDESLDMVELNENGCKSMKLFSEEIYKEQKSLENNLEVHHDFPEVEESYKSVDEMEIFEEIMRKVVIREADAKIIALKMVEICIDDSINQVVQSKIKRLEVEKDTLKDLIVRMNEEDETLRNRMRMSETPKKSTSNDIIKIRGWGGPAEMKCLGKNSPIRIYKNKPRILTPPACRKNTRTETKASKLINIPTMLVKPPKLLCLRNVQDAAEQGGPLRPQRTSTSSSGPPSTSASRPTMPGPNSTSEFRPTRPWRAEMLTTKTPLTPPPPYKRRGQPSPQPGGGPWPQRPPSLSGSRPTSPPRTSLPTRSNIMRNYLEKRSSPQPT